MAKCVDITPKKKDVCLGALRYRVAIYDRVISGGVQGNIAHTEAYTLLKTVKASIETKQANITQTLDGVVIDPELLTTHIFLTRYAADITTEQFIVFKGLVYKIIKAENIDEQGTWMRLKANLRGDFSKLGAQ